MVLLKLETEPGRGQFKTNYLRSEREITREVRKRRPQWIAGGAECHKNQSQPLLHSHSLLIGNHILSHADTKQLPWWPFVQTLDTLIFGL